MIKVERKIDDLTKEVWTFVDINYNICMTGYSLLKKKSTRNRTWTSDIHFDTYLSRGSTIKEIDVPLPEYVKLDAFNHYISKLRVCKFSERKR